MQKFIVSENVDHVTLGQLRCAALCQNGVTVDDFTDNDCYLTATGRLFNASSQVQCLVTATGTLQRVLSSLFNFISYRELWQ